VSEAGKLSSNEAPFGPSPAARDAIIEMAGDAHRYPEARSLVELIAAAEQVAEEQVIVTNGSDELCYLLALLFIADGTRVVLSDPSYQIDELVSQLYDAERISVPLASDGGHDLDAMLEQIDDAGVVWLPTPHNPTGVPVDPEALERFVAAVPAGTLVVVDEAYRAYVAPEQRPDVRRLLERHPNVIVQRTFSKEHGLAGLRVGYGIGATPVIDSLNRIRPPFNVNAAAVAAAKAALGAPAWRDYTVGLVVRERELLLATLRELGVECYASQANFVTFRVDDASGLLAALSDAGLMVRDGSDLGLPGSLRASVGTPVAMAQLRSVLKEVL
jgi:histidinol-phosphate aminotransferase